MEIIIHGKPGSRSSQMTPGLDNVLGNRIVDGFFNSMGSINEAGYMVVDAIFWDREWYSVYTFVLSRGITDIADRPSYFAISIVLQGQYYCLVSEVYKQLKKVCSNYVIGNCISSDGKYLIPDFEDKLLFDGLVKEINKDYTNMLEDFDKNFRPVQEPQNNIFYNPIDCDAKAFVQSLRVNGRVIVCESAKAKDSLLGNVDKINSKLQQAQSIMQSKDVEIERLNKELSAIKTTLNDTGKKSGKRLNELENGVKALKAENETLKNLNQSYVSAIDSLRSKFTEIINIAKTVEKDNKRVEPQLAKQPQALGNRSKLLIVSFVNTLLLIFLTFLLCIKSCESVYDRDKVEVSERESKAAMSDAKSNSDEAQSIDIDKAESTETVNYNTYEGKLDEDCGVSIMTDTSIPIASDAYIAAGSAIYLNVNKMLEGYDIHTYNLKNSENLKMGKVFNVIPVDKNKPIIISYRTANINNLNPKNKITLHVKQ